MENGPDVGNTVRHRGIHARTVVIAVTVSFLIVPHFLNGASYNALVHDVYSGWWGKGAEERRMTQISYVVVGVLANALFAFLFQRYRRKTCLYLVCISQITTSIILLITTSYWMRHVARACSAISGVGAGMFCVIYVSEIATDEMRGGLVASHRFLYVLAESAPVIMYLIGTPLKSLFFSCVSIVISALVAMWSFMGVPESPVYFLRREDIEGAKRSMEILSGNGEQVSEEIAKKRKILKATRSDSQTTTSILQDCTNRRTLTLSCIALLLYLMRDLSGFSLARIQVEGQIWKIPSVDDFGGAYYLLIDVGVMIVGSLLTVVLCDHVGRKILFLASSLGSSIALILTGITFSLHEYFDYSYEDLNIPFFVLSLIYLVSFYIGISSLPEVLMTDIFPPKILNTQIAILGSFHLCVDFVVHHVLFEPAIPTLGFYGLYWLFGGLCCIGTFLIFMFLPETKCRPSGCLLTDNEEIILYSTLQDDE